MPLDAVTTAVIVNPAAAAGRVGRRWSRFEPRLRRHLGNVRFLKTTAQGDAVRLAQRAVEDGAKTVLSLGGDGTHNEVVNGIMVAGAPAGTVAFGVLPAGTGGDFRRLLRDSNTLDQAAASLGTAEATPIDLGRVRFEADDGAPLERWFLNIASFGVGGLVDRRVARSSKHFGGRVTFLVATIRELAAYTPAQVQLTVDGLDVGTFTISNVSVANGQFFGGGMHIAPQARLADGLLDVVVQVHRPLAQALPGTPALYRGTHLDHPDVHVFRGRRIEARAVGDEPAWLDIDGESPGRIPATIEVAPGAIRLLAPRPEVL